MMVNLSIIVRRDVLKKKRLRDAELQEIKSEVKTIIKKIKKRCFMLKECGNRRLTL